VCAINGYVNYDNLKNQDVNNNRKLKKILQIMNQSNRFRGPDGSDIIIDNNVGLGHNLLAISGSSINLQPAVTDNGNIMVYNGECYDVTGFDTPYVVEQFEKRRIDFLKNINAHFAIAFYDKKKQEITLARDHFGVKPLFYHYTAKKLVFSSTLHGIISAGVKPKPSFNIIENEDVRVHNPKLRFRVKSSTKYEQMINHFYKSNGSWMGKQIGYDNVFSLCPGQYITFSTKSARIISSGSLFDFTLENNLKDMYDIKDIISEQVHNVGDTSKNFSIALSGGLDSGAIGSILKNKDPYYITVTTQMNNNNQSLEENTNYSSDYYYARKNAEKFGKMLHWPAITISNYKRLVDETSQSLLFPAQDPARLACRLLLPEYSKMLGGKVIISGEGGDELFTGYRQHNDFFRRIGNKLEINFNSALGYSKILKKHWIEMQNEMEYFPTWCKGPDMVNNALLLSIFKSASFFCMVQDQLCGMHSIENRTPFLTISFVKKMLSIPSYIKFKRYKNVNSELYHSHKYILRKCFEKDLHPEVVNRNDKSGFVSPSWHRGLYNYKYSFSGQRYKYHKETYDYVENYSNICMKKIDHI